MAHRITILISCLAISAGLSSLAASPLAGTLVSPAVAAQNKHALTPPDSYASTILIYTVMAGLHNAHVSGNYTVLRDISSPRFRTSNTAARLGEIFAAQRKHKINIAAALLYQPKLDTAAYVDKNGLLQIRGYFDTSPQRLVFNLSFQQSAGAWRLFGINVALTKPPAS